MKSASISIAAFAFCAGTLMMTRDARALGPVDLEIGAKVGMGTNPIGAKNSAPDAPNPLGFGLGGRAGVSFLGIYGGVQLMYYFGSSQDQTIGGTTLSESEHSLLYGIEAGYGLTLVDILTIRPQLGIGNYTLTGSASGSGPGVSVNTPSQSKSNLYLEPGVTGLVSLGMWFVGADANLLFLPGFDVGPSYDSKVAFTLHGQVGIKL
jgi:hypothetical protein